MNIYTSYTALSALTTKIKSNLNCPLLNFFESFGTETFFIRNRAKCNMYTPGYTTDKINISVDYDAVRIYWVGVA